VWIDRAFHTFTLRLPGFLVSRAGRLPELVIRSSIKEASGKVVGDATLEAKGNIEKNLGKVQAKVGDIRQDLKHSAK